MQSTYTRIKKSKSQIVYVVDEYKNYLLFHLEI